MKHNHHLPSPPIKSIILLGEMLKLARKQQKWRQIDLAKRLGTSRQTVARIECGDPSVAIGLYISAAWLLDSPIFPGMAPKNNTSSDILKKFITLLEEQLPQRISKLQEKPIDDDF